MNDRCEVCTKVVYAPERLSADGKVFHKTCFRCAHCKGQLKLGNYASLQGQLYCKPHFKQLFALKGNYSEAFGQEKPTAKWTNREKRRSGEHTTTVVADSQTQTHSDDLSVRSSNDSNETSIEAPSANLKAAKSIFEQSAPAEPAASTTSRYRQEAASIGSSVKSARSVFEQPAAAASSQPAPRAHRASVATAAPVRHEQPAIEEKREPQPAETVVTAEAPKVAVKGDVKGARAIFEQKPEEQHRERSVAVDTTGASNARAFFQQKTSEAAGPSGSRRSMTTSRVSVQSERCEVCSKSVYLTDRLSADGKVFHKTCFRCTHCTALLKLGNYASLQGKLYCKPHFKQLFALKGNYSEAFGQEKPTAKWTNRQQSSEQLSSDQEATHQHEQLSSDSHQEAAHQHEQAAHEHEAAAHQHEAAAQQHEQAAQELEATQHHEEAAHEHEVAAHEHEVAAHEHEEAAIEHQIAAKELEDSEQ